MLARIAETRRFRSRVLPGAWGQNQEVFHHMQSHNSSEHDSLRTSLKVLVLNVVQNAFQEAKTKSVPTGGVGGTMNLFNGQTIEE
jgi:hypothetical protein